MPVLDLEKLEKLSPTFKGKFGHALGKAGIKLFAVDKINQEYDKVCSHRGIDFAHALLNDLGINYTINGKKPSEVNLDLPQGAFITISNHPIGSADGVILADLFGQLRSDYKLLVNKFLMLLEAFTPCLIPVTPKDANYAGVTPDSISGIRGALQHIKDGHPLGLFPSGAVSDKILGSRPTVELSDKTTGQPLSYTEPKIRDREWQMPIIRFIQKAGVPVLPVRFFDGNSNLFYNLGLIDWKVRLIQMPREILNKAGQTIRLGVGPLITPEQIKAIPNLEELRTYLRATVYAQEPCI